MNCHFLQYQVSFVKKDHQGYQSLDHIVYEYALPMSVQFPKSVLGTRSPEQLSMAIRWPVLITNPVGLENLLTTMDTSIFVPS